MNRSTGASTGSRKVGSCAKTRAMYSPSGTLTAVTMAKKIPTWKTAFQNIADLEEDGP